MTFAGQRSERRNGKDWELEKSKYKRAFMDFGFTGVLQMIQSKEKKGKKYCILPAKISNLSKTIWPISY